MATSNTRTSILTGALSGAAAGAPLGPYGAIGGALVGGFLGFQLGEDLEEAQRERDEEIERAQIQSQFFQSEQRAQRLALLDTGRRFAEEQPRQLGSLAQLSNTPVTGQGSLTSGTF